MLMFSECMKKNIEATKGNFSDDLKACFYHLHNYHRIIEAQNCKGWKGPLETTQSNFPASLQWVAQGSVQVGLDYL